MSVLCANQFVCLLFEGDLSIPYFCLCRYDLGLSSNECNYLHTVNILSNEDKSLRRVGIHQ